MVVDHVDGMLLFSCPAWSIYVRITLEIPYATTIHKAQGSEYPLVVMPVLMTHYVMLQRNLVYTGITRAKKGLVIVGTKKALALAVRNVTVTRRNTKLRDRLRVQV